MQIWGYFRPKSGYISFICTESDIGRLHYPVADFAFYFIQCCRIFDVLPTEFLENILNAKRISSHM